MNNRKRWFCKICKKSFDDREECLSHFCVGTRYPTDEIKRNLSQYEKEKAAEVRAESTTEELFDNKEE